MFKYFLLSTLLVFSPAMHTMGIGRFFSSLNPENFVFNDNADENDENNAHKKNSYTEIEEELNQLLTNLEKPEQISVLKCLYNMMPSNPSQYAPKDTTKNYSNDIENIIKQASKDQSVLVKYIYNLNTIFNNTEEKKDFLKSNAVLHRNNIEGKPLGFQLNQHTNYKFNGYSMLGITIAACMKENLRNEKVLNQIAGLQDLSVKPSKKDKRLAKLEFYHRTPEITEYHIVLCATLGYNFKNKNEKPCLSSNIIQQIVSYLPYYKNSESRSLIPYDSYFNQNFIN